MKNSNTVLLALLGAIALVIYKLNNPPRPGDPDFIGPVQHLQPGDPYFIGPVQPANGNWEPGGATGSW